MKAILLAFALLASTSIAKDEDSDAAPGLDMDKMLKQMGDLDLGDFNMQDMMKNLGGEGGMDDLLKGMDVGKMAEMAAGLAGGKKGGAGGGPDLAAMMKMAGPLLSGMGGGGGGAGAGGMDLAAMMKMAGPLLAGMGGGANGGAEGLDLAAMMKMAGPLLAGMGGGANGGAGGMDLAGMMTMAAPLLAGIGGGAGDGGMDIAAMMQMAAPLMAGMGGGAGAAGGLDEIVKTFAGLGDGSGLDLEKMLKMAGDLAGTKTAKDTGLDAVLSMLGGKEGAEALQNMLAGGGMDKMMQSVENLVKDIENDPRMGKFMTNLEGLAQTVGKRLDFQKMIARLGGANGLMGMITSFDIFKITKLVGGMTKAAGQLSSLGEEIMGKIETEGMQSKITDAFGGQEKLLELADVVLGQDGMPDYAAMLTSPIWKEMLENMFSNSDFVGDMVDDLMTQLDFADLTKKLNKIADSIDEAIPDGKPKQKKPKAIKAAKAKKPDLSKFAAMVDKLGGIDKVVTMMGEMGMSDMLEQAGGVDALRSLVEKQKNSKHSEL